MPEGCCKEFMEEWWTAEGAPPEESQEMEVGSGSYSFLAGCLRMLRRDSEWFCSTTMRGEDECFSLRTY